MLHSKQRTHTSQVVNDLLTVDHITFLQGSQGENHFMCVSKVDSMVIISLYVS